MADQKYKITKQLGIIKEKKGGWTKELNIVSWYDGAPKYDIRDWSKDHQKMSKGATLTEEELVNLYYLIGELFFDKPRESANDTGNGSPESGDKAAVIATTVEEIADIKEAGRPSDSGHEDIFMEELMKMEESMKGKD